MTGPDPSAGYRFLVELDGVASAGFMEVSGRSAAIAPVDYRESSDRGATRTLPGLRTFGDVGPTMGLPLGGIRECGSQLAAPWAIARRAFAIESRTACTCCSSENGLRM